jgi:hypothetical protein
VAFFATAASYCAVAPADADTDADTSTDTEKRAWMFALAATTPAS